VPPKSPPWTRDETILALDLYYRMGRRVPNPGDLPVIQVSRYLNQLPIHDLSVRASNFRNPSGVVLKIANLRAFDKSTGELLWETTLPFSGNATPATYEIDGRQYVVIAAGSGKDPKQGSGGIYVAFALPRPSATSRQKN